MTVTVRMIMSDKALSGINVFDLSRFVAGSYCTKLLSAYGADVIVVEAPRHGAPLRRSGRINDDEPHTAEKNPHHLYLNTGKKSVTLDISKSRGKDLLKHLISRADIVVEDFPPRQRSELGLDYDVLRKVKPDLIMASITDFGQDGPYRHFAGGRLVEYALSGYAYVNGDPDREPLAGGGEQPSYQGGLHAYAGIMSALIAREITGVGHHIDVSIMECMASLHQFTINRYVFSKKMQKRGGNRHVWSHPITAYPCRDGYVCICAGTEDQARMLLTLTGKEKALEDPRFSAGLQRLINADAFDALVGPWFLTRTRKEIVEDCQEWRIPASPVNDMGDLFRDEQLNARGYWTSIDHPETGRLPYAGPPFKMSETPAEFGRAPLLGEHNDEIYLRRLGLSRDELERLVKDGVI